MRKILSIFILLFFGTALLHSQEDSKNSYADSSDEIIQWVAQYPDEDAASKRTFIQKVGDLVLGPKPDLVIKPVGAFSDGPDNVWMLSQGNGYVLKLSENRFESVAEEILKNKHYYPSLVSLCSLPGRGMLVTDSYLNQAILISENEEKIIRFNKRDVLDQPTGIAYSKTMDQVWIIETGSHRISVFDVDGAFIKNIGQRGSEPGDFNFPTHIWIDEKGKAYVVDAMNFRIQIFNEKGEYLSSFGKTGDATGCLARPKGIATDSKGNIFVADALFNIVQVFNEQGELLYYFGEEGSEKGQFKMPAGVFIDQKDRIYVSDSFNNRVQVFQLTKEI